MQITESAQIDPQSNRRGRPRALEQQRKNVLQSEAIKNYCSIFPIILESGLYTAIFLYLYKFFRENGFQKVASYATFILSGGITKDPIQFGVSLSNIENTILTVAQKFFMGMSYQSIVSEAADKTVKDLTEYRFKRELEISKDYGYPGSIEPRTFNQSEFSSWFQKFQKSPFPEDKLKWKLYIQDLIAMTKEAGAQPKDYAMDPLTAAAWAAILVIMLKTGTGAVSSLVQKVIPG